MQQPERGTAHDLLVYKIDIVVSHGLDGHKAGLFSNPGKCYRIHCSGLRKIDIDPVSLRKNPLLAIGRDIGAPDRYGITCHIQTARRLKDKDSHGVRGKGLHLAVDRLKIDPFSSGCRDSLHCGTGSRKTRLESFHHLLCFTLLADKSPQDLPVIVHLVDTPRLKRYHEDTAPFEFVNQPLISEGDHRPYQYQIRTGREEFLCIIMIAEDRFFNRLWGIGLIAANTDNLLIKAKDKEILRMGPI